MKNFLTPLFVVVILISALQATAQFSLQNINGTFTPLVGATPVDGIETDDDVSAAIPIGFSFSYMGNSYNNVYASSNGFVSFSSLIESHYINNLAGNRIRTLAPLWDDLSGGEGSASYALTGTAPNRVFTFEWLNWRWNYNASAGISFQVKLYESTHQIEYIYQPESGALNNPSASVGLTGNVAGQYLSVTNLSATASVAPLAVNNISEKPAQGKTLRLIPQPPGVAPTTQATGANFPNLTSVTAEINWINGNGSLRAVFMKQTSAIESAAPVNGTTYSPSTSFGNGTEIGSSDWFCVYVGDATSVQVTNLISTFTYRVHVVEYNAGDGFPQYNTQTNGTNPGNFTTPLGPPTGQVSALSGVRISSSDFHFSLGRANAASTAVFMKAADDGTASPVNSNTYAANTVFGMGAQIGTSGWYCVYNGSTSQQVTVTNLSPNTTYRLHAVEYNGSPGNEQYFVGSNITNPFALTTFAYNLTSYTFTPSAGSFTPLTGGTAVNDIENNNTISTYIPIGFTFHFGGNPFTNAVASSNGYLSLNPFAITSGTGISNSLTSSIARPLIAPLWDDLSGIGGQASYLTTGVAPNRIFTFEWLNWRWSNDATAPVISFQVKLYELDSKIEFIYRKENTAVSNTASASIGLAFPNVGVGNFISLNNTSAAPSVVTPEVFLIDTKPDNGQVYAFTPQKTAQTINFSAIADQTYGVAPFEVSPNATSGLPVTLSSLNTAVATVQGNTVTVVGVGTATIRASQPGNPVYDAAPDVDQVFNVNQASQLINFPALSNMPYSPNGTIDPNATASSGLPVSYQSSNPNVITVSGSVLQIVGIGSSNITASQPGNAFYSAAANVVRPITITKADQLIDFPALGNVEYSTGGTVDPGATASSGLPVSYVSSNPGVVSVNGNVLNILGLGTSDITAKQSGNSFYNVAPNYVQTITIIKGSNSINFPELAPMAYTPSATVQLNVTASSGLPVSYLNSNSSVASLTGNTLTILGVGSTDITAMQAGNALFDGAQNVVRTLVVNKGDQQLAFGELPSKTYGDAPFTLSASASTPTAIVFTSSNPQVATVTGNTVTILKPGTTTITASQVGNALYNESIVDRTLVVSKAGQIVSFDPLPGKAFGDAPFNITASSTSGLPVGFMSSDPSVASVSGSTVTILKGGTTTITAAQEGNDFYLPANVQQVLTVGKIDPEFALDNSNRTLGDMPFELSAVTSHNVSFHYEIVAQEPQGIASINGNTVSILDIGVITIRVTAIGDDSYNQKWQDFTMCFIAPKPVIGVEFLPGDMRKLFISNLTPNSGSRKWFKNGALVSESAELITSDDGTYTVDVKGANICSSISSDPFTLIISGTPIGEGKSMPYPNPSKDNIHIDLPANIPSTVSIVNSLAQTVASYEAEGGIDLAIDKLEVGVYTLRIVNQEGVIFYKIVKE